ncbi:FliM/FliN family flagellar motor switch protein [Salipiger pacificus]|uniref:FliM/FliN family flagellar motor switch protein n=2 Tax=Salipiger mangrovisoli TaxID=2865933 RepID=A0ABR9WVC7_9RHOB|nr:FliM/FliN family flagellar motor switch protein [Salipiger mangrovisoli]
MSPAKALRRALSRSADVLWDLALVAHAVEQDHLDQDGVVAQLPSEALLLLLDGPDGVVGFVTLDRDLVTGLTEVQTMLQVTQMPAEPRPFTATDAAMTAPLLDAMLERFARFLEDHPLRAQVEGFRFGAMLEDARAAGLLLDAPGYMMFRAMLDLALGRRRGELRLFLPERPGARRSTPAGQPGTHERKMVLLPAQMRADLGSLRMPLKRAQALRPGDLLPLPPEVLDGVTLHAGPGAPVAGGRLGQVNGMRAVRLSWPHVPAQGDVGTEPSRGPAVGAFGAPQAPAGPAATEEFGLAEMASDLPDLPDLPGSDAGDVDFAASFGAEAQDEDPVAMDFDFDFSAAPIDDEE